MAVKFRDYYEVLGVPRTATVDEIQRAYRQLARKHHPDLKTGAERNAATEHFKHINEAYEVLKDVEKRAKYDALGEGWQNGADFNPPPGSEWRTAAPQDFEDIEGFSDFFSSLFGGVHGNGRGARSPRAGEELEAELPVTIDDLVHGPRRRITLGGGRSLEVAIPLGARDGTMLRLAGQGRPGRNGGPSGDLFLRLRLTPDPRFSVEGDDVEMALPLWPWQAVLGASVRVETPHGAVTLKVPEGTQAEQRLRLRGRGLPHKDGSRGDLHAVVGIVIPKHPSDAERAGYEALKGAAAAPADRPAED